MRLSSLFRTVWCLYLCTAGNTARRRTVSQTHNVISHPIRHPLIENLSSVTRIPDRICPSDWDILRYPWRGQLPGFGPLVFSPALWNLVGIRHIGCCSYFYMCASEVCFKRHFGFAQDLHNSLVRVLQDAHFDWHLLEHSRVIQLHSYTLAEFSQTESFRANTSPLILSEVSQTWRLPINRSCQPLKICLWNIRSANFQPVSPLSNYFPANFPHFQRFSNQLPADFRTQGLAAGLPGLACAWAQRGCALRSLGDIDIDTIWII